MLSSAALAGSGTLTYQARVVHNNRAAMTVVNGTVDLASGSFEERIADSFRLDFRRMPAQMLPARAELPVVWGVGGRTAQRYGVGLPRYDSPLLRHFLVGNVLGGLDQLAEGQSHLNGQLSIEKFSRSETGFELVCKLRGAALVVVGSLRPDAAGNPLPESMAVLGPGGELYQYQFETAELSAQPPELTIALPAFDAQEYVSFPGSGSAETPIRPIKDWLVFQAELPNGRPLNLIFDSGADVMIVDDMVLRLDADLEPQGEAIVDSGIGQGQMQAYEGFGFNIGDVEFRNLPVMGAPLTFAGLGSEVRIHGIVGNELLQLCQLDLDLRGGTLRLARPDTPAPTGGEMVPLRFIQQLPHIEAQVYDTGPSLFLLDTGQRQPLTVNLDFLADQKLDDSLVMDGFMGDIRGGLAPNYMLEELHLQLGGRTYLEKTVGATPVHSYDYEGTQVVGAIGFPLLARRFGGITFDYRRRALYLREPGEYATFGRPEAWGGTALERSGISASADEPQAEPAARAQNEAEAAAAAAEPPAMLIPAPPRFGAPQEFVAAPQRTATEQNVVPHPESANVDAPVLGQLADTPKFNRMTPGAKVGGKTSREEVWAALWRFASGYIGQLSQRGRAVGNAEAQQ